MFRRDGQVTIERRGLPRNLGATIAQDIYHLARRGFRLAGLDISPSAIKLAQEACAEQRIAFEGRVSDMCTIPWPDATFDAALSTSTIHHRRVWT